MRKLILVLAFLMVTTLGHARNINITLTYEEYKAMSVMTVTPEEWIQHAATNKARKMTEELVGLYSDYQPRKLDKASKDAVINSIDIEAEKEKRNKKDK